MRHIASNVLTMMIVAGLVLTAVIAFGKEQFSAQGPLAQEIVVEVPSGASLRDTSEILSGAGAIDNAFLFRLGARYSGRDQDLKAGEYRLEPGASMDEILGIIVSGRSVQYRVTVPEGLTSHEVVALLGEAQILSGEAPAAPPEGMVAPDTHFVARGQARQDVLQKMLDAQQAILAEAWENRQPDLPLANPEEMLILASIVQSEAGGGELREVASVFINRLRRGLRLEADATVRYGVTLGKEKLGRGLRRSELEKVTPYNTYKIAALPPTPISNPGRAAIEAVSDPAETDYLFFVADGTGGHAFSRSYEEHLENVKRWREIEKSRQVSE
ncbi:MAG: endolytic transglycosylase MltG [Pseudomonadota bacterium]